MLDNDKESVLRRIQKLLAIATDDRADPNEAAAAAGMAEKIMRKYQIEHQDVIVAGLKKGEGLSTADIVASAKTNGTSVKLVPLWANLIAAAVSKLVECTVILAKNKDGEACVRFHGFAADVELASWIYTYLVNTTTRLVNTYKTTSAYKEEGRKALNSYRMGVAIGIARAVKAAAAEKEAELRTTGGSALTVAKLSAIAAVFGKHSLIKKRTAASSRGDSFLTGLQDGRNVDVNRRAVGSSSPSTLQLN